MNRLVLLFLLFLSLDTFGQATGEIEFPTLGLSFTIPDGWIGQEMEMGYLIASNTIAGLILLLPHDQIYTMQQIRTQAIAGLNEGNGTNLQLTGALTDVDANTISGEFEGTMEYQAAKAHIIGMRNSYGLGLTIVAMTTSELYNNTYRTYAQSLMKSVRFMKPESKEDIGEWKEWMKNVKLTYMESYYSPGANVSGGYNINREIDLCGAGYFIFHGSSNISIGGDNASGYDHSNDQGNGQWDVVAGPTGDPALVLNYASGETASYVLTYADEKLYLDGTRYFRTMDGDYAPSCE